ncbi:MAG: RNA polymerase sigma factor RpoD/SigA [Fibrobacteria bacterium]|nr:RNA polymerase sigma factor RpoD/SigA [Fibrobacteria bacterium]
MSGKSGVMWEDLKSYYQYIRDIDKYPLLTKPEERELLLRIQKGDQTAIKKLVCSNLKFVINVAFKYRNQGFALTELINEGNIGLIESARRFDINKKIRFISYAVWWIRQSITRAISEKARLVRISAEKELILRRINKYTSHTHFTIGGGIKIDANDLGKKMGYTQKQMEKILEMGNDHFSLDQPLSSEGTNTANDIIKDKKCDAPDELAVLHSRNEFLERKLNELDEIERRVLKMYFGIEYTDKLSLKDIGEVIGLSKERIRQIKEEALKNLRRFAMPKELLLAA